MTRLTIARPTMFALMFAVCAACPAKPDPTVAYIDHAWSVLSRSMDDCATFGDTKLSGKAVLYLPFGMAVPAETAKLKQACGVDVHSLPRRIEKLGELTSDKLPAQGVLYLPHAYVVPGGRFNEMYGWDSYFIVIGLLADHRAALAKGMVDNFLFEVENYGAVLNANRTYYLTRSQPPFLGEMIRSVLDDPDSFHDKAEADAWLAHAYPLAVRDHDVWLRKEHRAGDTGLARYFDFGGAAPVPEMSDDNSYFQGVIKWLIAHPAADRGYLIKASEHPDAREAAHLATVSCDVRASAVCAHAWADGRRLSADFYRGDRAMRESGFDTSFRFGAYGGSTHHYAAVGLNSLLYRYEHDLHDFAARLGRAADADRWTAAADARRKAMNKYLWRADQGMYMDYDFVAGKPSDYVFITTFYPLWVGAASKDQAQAVDAHLKLFERKGGLQTSTRATGAQWDAPFGWAPTNWIAVAGLDASGFHDDARRIAREFTATIDRGLADDGTIREKYNMETGNAQVEITAGYKANVIGFGWTNGVYLNMRRLLQSAPAAASGHD
jgi:alpha,alpha-trehalase